ncbi:MAG TPA: DUF262 domain-containing protein [Pyrinomonadaceae bacterium]|nr:DUF262 domain-containing protein [Pyrinomonadaceae bacterium]
MERPESSSYTINDFDDWRQGGTLELTPKFQRREVWKTPARSYFIDSILKGIPIPPISIRLGQSQDNRKIVKEVIDGQQRLRAVLDYIDEKYALSKSVGGPHARKRFSQLDQGDHDAILKYGFRCDVFKSVSDAEVLEIFARVNTYSVGLNNQELRNGRFFGHFKQFVYALAYEHLEFWRRYKIFSENSIARMLEVELTSELVVAELAGQQDKKKSLDDFYRDFDEEFPGRQKIGKTFKTSIDWISETLGDDLASSEFHRPPLFYTLFAVVYHRLFGLPGESLASSKSQKLRAADQRNLLDAVRKRRDILSKSTSSPTLKLLSNGNLFSRSLS